MKNFNNVTILPVTCPKCGYENPEKHITFKAIDGVEEREAAKRKAMSCDSCKYDIYSHNKKELGV